MGRDSCSSSAHDSVIPRQPSSPRFPCTDSGHIGVTAGCLSCHPLDSKKNRNTKVNPDVGSIFPLPMLLNGCRSVGLSLGPRAPCPSGLAMPFHSGKTSAAANHDGEVEAEMRQGVQGTKHCQSHSRLTKLFKPQNSCFSPHQVHSKT